MRERERERMMTDLIDRHGLLVPNNVEQRGDDFVCWDHREDQW